MKESVYQRKVLALLRKRGAYAEVISASAFQAAGIPDVLACYKGIWLGLELKVKYNKPSPLQVTKIEMIREAGGVGAILWDNLEPLEYILDSIDLGDVENVRTRYTVRGDSYA